MSRSPKNSVIQRIFVSVDKSWQGNDFTLVTVKPYAAAAIKALNCMISECTYLYGEEAVKRWFSNAGLMAYQNVNWDPSTEATTSHQDHTTQALVEEDLFELGSAWMSQAPILQPQANRPHSHHEQYYSVENLLESRQTDNEVHSFGSVFGRQHDGESVATEAPPPPVPPTTVIVQIDPNLEPRSQAAKDDAHSYDASSAGFTTGSTRAKLHQKGRAMDRLLKENHELVARLANQDSDDDSRKTTKSTADLLTQTLARLDLVEKEKAALLNARQIVSPEQQDIAPAFKELTVTVADSDGRNA
jgi:hypothetical protein